MRPSFSKISVLLLLLAIAPCYGYSLSEGWDDEGETLTEALTRNSVPIEDLEMPMAPQVMQQEESRFDVKPKPQEKPAEVASKPVKALMDEGAHKMGGIAERVIQTGDKIIYRVIEDRDVPVTVPVLETGEVIVPYFGPVQAAGMTPSQLSKKIEHLLTQELYEKASVIIVVQKPAPASFLGTIFLSGRVNRIGPMQIDPNQNNTLSKVILTAGGFADFADSSSVQIIRRLPDSDETEMIEVDVRSIIEKGKLEKDVEVKDGDFIIVPQRLFNW